MGDMVVGNAFLLTDEVVEAFDTVENARSRSTKGATLGLCVRILLLLDDRFEWVEGCPGTWDDSGAVRVSNEWREVFADWAEAYVGWD